MPVPVEPALLRDAVFGPLFGLGLIGAAGWDLARRRVPNALNAAIAAAGLAWQMIGAPAAGAVGGPLEGLLDGALGMLTGLGVVIVPFALRLYRGGDAKLVIALGAWLGPGRTAWAFLWGAAFGAAVALGVLAVAGRDLRRRVARNLKLAAGTVSLPAVEPDRGGRHHVPMALAFAGGALAALLWG